MKERHGDRQRVSLVLIEISKNGNNRASLMPLAAMAADASLTRPTHTHTHNLLLPFLKLTQWRANCAVRGPIEKGRKHYFYYFSNRKDITIGRGYTEPELKRQWHWSAHWKGECTPRNCPSYFGSTFVRYWSCLSGRPVQFLPSHACCCIALLFFSAALLLTEAPCTLFYWSNIFIRHNKRQLWNGNENIEIIHRCHIIE